MRAAVLWCSVGVLLLVAQAIWAGSISPVWIPDLSLLAVVAAALVLGPAEGLIVACLIGFGTDMLSGSLMGQHAFVRVLEFVVVRGFAGQLDLVRFLPQVVTGLGLSAMDAALMAGLGAAFTEVFPLSWTEVGVLMPRALLTAACAPLVGRMAIRVTAWLSDDDTRHEIRLATRRAVL